MSSFIAFTNGGEEPKWPQEIFLDTSRTCNLKCVMCVHHSAENSDARHGNEEHCFADLSFFKAPIQSLLPYALAVHPMGYGEPTLHPQFCSYLDYLSDYEVLIDFVSNGTRLDEKFCDFLVSRHIFAITVSFSGSTRSDYEKIYVGAKFKQVLDGMNRLKQAKGRHQSPYPLLFVNSLAFQHHLDNFVDFVELMADHGVNKIFLRPLNGVTYLPKQHDQITVFRPWKDGQNLQRALERA
ncbi:MAG: radical SAM protein [Deltaproteobacteria bacterium]|nr:radical SAM protein [Deltaproteobacteria bacterium]